jgi:hypothetical protein
LKTPACQKEDKLFVWFVNPEKIMKSRATSNRSSKRPNANPGEGANAVASEESVQAVKARHAKSKPRAPKAAAVEAPPQRVARHRGAPARRETVVRDTFTMPRDDYEKLAELKHRCLEAGLAVKKSELVRAGLLLLASKPTKGLLAAVKAVEPVKTGRPPKSK